jgi:uncharacterized RDD family membrane protein YckC
MESNVHKIANNRQRLLAFFIDTIPIVLVLALISYFFLGFDEVFDRYIHRGDKIEPREEFIKQRNLIREFSFLVWLVYCIFMESSVHQGTFGKKVMGIKVVNKEGARLTFLQSLHRNSCKTLSYIVNFLGFAWILVDKNKQGLHDNMCGTLVVEV